MANRIDKAFEGRWRFKGCKDGGMNLSLSIKELCKDFFEAGVAYNLTTNRSNHTKCPSKEDREGEYKEYWLYDK